MNENNNKFVQAMEKEVAWKETENGQTALNTTFDACLDLFSTIGALRKRTDGDIEAKVGAAQSCQPLLAHLYDILAVVDYFPGGGSVHSGQGVHKRGLSGAGGSHNNGEIPLIEVDIHLREYVHLPAPVSEALADTLCGKYSIFHNVSPLFGFGFPYFTYILPQKLLRSP